VSGGPSGGGGVICETRALPGAVIPAKAGIYSASHWKCVADGLDSRFRGNDWCFERDSIANDTSTQVGVVTHFAIQLIMAIDCGEMGTRYCALQGHKIVAGGNAPGKRPHKVRP
jgi:hypothetical protein